MKSLVFELSNAFDFNEGVVSPKLAPLEAAKLNRSRVARKKGQSTLKPRIGPDNSPYFQPKKNASRGNSRLRERVHESSDGNSTDDFRDLESGSRLRASVDIAPPAPSLLHHASIASLESSASTWSHESDKYVRASNMALVKFAPSVSAAGASAASGEALAEKIRKSETRHFMERKQRQDSKAVYTGGFGSSKVGRLPAVMMAIEATVMKLILLREQHLTEIKHYAETIDKMLEEAPLQIDREGDRDIRCLNDNELESTISPRFDALIVSVAQLRGTSVEVVEAVVKWRRAAERLSTGASVRTPSGRFFKWEGKNYLTKMRDDVDVLEEYQTIKEGLGFSIIGNPFLLPPKSASEATSSVSRSRVPSNIERVKWRRKVIGLIASC